jgi:molecular chaperone GrpE
MDDDVTIERDGREEDGMSEVELDAVESRVDGKLQKLKRELEQCKKERQEYLDGWQRAKADYVNAQKRAEDERVQAGKAAARKAVEAFLPAIDSLARAEAMGGIPEGFAGIAKQLAGSAESAGLERFGAVGDAFDPNLHEALGEDPAGPGQDHTVSAVLEAGWKLRGEVLRPARVRVYMTGA